MSNYTEGPNPLRPYYKPPSVGLPVEAGSNSPSTHAISKHAASITKSSFGSSARDILSDLDYSDYISDTNPSSGEIIKKLLDQALWKYSSVLFAQPFEVAKTVLQVQLASSVKDGSTQSVTNDDMRRRPDEYRYDDYEVCLSIKCYSVLVDSSTRFLLTTPTQTLLPTSRLQLLFRVHLLRDLQGEVAEVDTCMMNIQEPRRETLNYHTHLRTQGPQLILTLCHLAHQLLPLCLIFGPPKGHGEYGKALTALLSIPSFLAQSRPLLDLYSALFSPFLTLVSPFRNHNHHI